MRRISGGMVQHLGRRDFMRLSALGAAPQSFLCARHTGGASCIVIWQSGGCSHLDTFDMKPEAPARYRGEFKPIPTNVPGIHICEHLPLTAKQMDKVAILRSMRSSETNHERAAKRLATGFPRSEAFPTRAAAGFERSSVRERYGRTDLGRRCLEARRMVERGARFVAVPARRLSWDTHADAFRTMRDILLPEFDRAFSALLEDLHDRGMLETTLVVAMGEFGRTPKINRNGGRDHHAGAWSVCLAGAGIPGGSVLGATDVTGTEVVDSPVEPQELLRTIRTIVGAGPEPPAATLAAGRVVGELFA
jgi:hypothetical protein